ncbi:MAG: GNAT family N-acetyltransferase [Bacteroidota bacterium]
MTIRHAKKEDIPQIIKLLKISLGESLMPKSIDYWQWKHIFNPFGESPVLLAFDNDVVIGVRAFMNWSWFKAEHSLSSIRPVDTATHPDYQGKGIFKKLTLQLLKESEKEGKEIVFNTPNSSSKPGYLKMGWKEVGKLPVKVSFKKPIKIIKSKLSTSNKTEFVELKVGICPVDEVIDKWPNKAVISDSIWKSEHTRQSILWRYNDIPVIKYYGSGDENAGVIFRLKRTGLGTELRICDHHGDRSDVAYLLKDIYSGLDFDYMTISGFSRVRIPGFFKKHLNIGPEVTVRLLSNNNSLGFYNFEKWKPSLGDLEVF